jgi:tight adherence protein B
MGAVLGLLVAVGLLLVHEGLTSPPTPRSSSRRGPLTDLLARGGLDDVTPARLLGSCAGVGASAALVMLVVSRTATIAVVFGLLAAWTPVGLLWRRAARRRAARWRPGRTWSTTWPAPCVRA